MIETPLQNARFAVTVLEREDGALAFVFRLRDIQPSPPYAKPFSRPEYTLIRHPGSDRFDWSTTENDPGELRSEFEAESERRLGLRVEWIARVTALVERVEFWAKEAGWSTRRIEKKLDDWDIGRHRLPALVMQEDTCRILLEPVGRSAPGIDGLVDLYLMPAYDDIANLYYADGRWHLYHVAAELKVAGGNRTGGAMPLSKETLEKVLADLKRHAA